MFHRHFTFDRMNRNAAIGRIVVSVNENCPEIDQCSRGMSISTGKYTSSSARSGPRRIQTIRAMSPGSAMRIFCIISGQHLRQLQALDRLSLVFPLWSRGYPSLRGSIEDVSCPLKEQWLRVRPLREPTHTARSLSFSPDHFSRLGSF